MFFYKFLIFVCDNVNANLANMGTGYLTGPFWRYRWDIYTSQLHSVLDWRCSDVVQACFFCGKIRLLVLILALICPCFRKTRILRYCRLSAECAREKFSKM